MMLKIFLWAVPLMWILLLIGTQLVNIFIGIEFEKYVKQTLSAIAIGVWWLALEQARRDM